MLPKAQRLSKEEFDVLWSTGERVHTPLFSFVYKKKEGIPQFAVVVSKKVASRAVDRNKVRRIGYAALVEILKKKEVKKSGIILIHRKKDVSVDTLISALSKVL